MGAEGAEGVDGAGRTIPSARCPRCAEAFHCGAHDPQPCACGSLALTEALRATLRARYSGCLCRACLLALGATPTTPRTPSPPTAIDTATAPITTAGGGG